METKELKMIQKGKQTIQLVKGVFTPSEASDVMVSLINEKINFHKLQRLQRWEKDNSFNSEQLDRHINELESEKENLIEIIANMEVLGKNLKINGTLEITPAD
ncbi:hypothetical protein [Sediminicola sp. YIK13]|uniref:hypothetical protein n=1 Tax=Sediminicola sp. YIK13 TaxID=1453352 RepID=UPI0007846FE1|nr:hypothetical protein [Sediminicola sp. YIK13]